MAEGIVTDLVGVRAEGMKTEVGWIGLGTWGVQEGVVELGAATGLAVSFIRLIYKTIRKFYLEN